MGTFAGLEITSGLDVVGGQGTCWGQGNKGRVDTFAGLEII